MPGRDTAWNPFLLWQYMQFRAEKCKPTSVFSALSALAHMGMKCGFVLPTTRFDGDALLYRQIRSMKREISLMHRAKHGVKGATIDIQRSTPLGRESDELLLLHFMVYDEEALLRLARIDRHNMMVSLMQHACGMRFGHFCLVNIPCLLLCTARCAWFLYAHYGLAQAFRPT